MSGRSRHSLLVTAVMLFLSFSMVLGASLTVVAPAEAADPVQTVTYLGGVLPAGQPVGTLDTTTDYSLNGGATWQPAYLVGGGHPWGIVPGTNSWINCGPSLNSCLNQTVDFRVRFVVPDGYSNPQMTFTVIADNAANFYLNGQKLRKDANDTDDKWTFNSDVSIAALTVTTPLGSMVDGTNTMIIRVKDWGGLAGFNYKAVITMNAPSPIISVAPANNLPTISAAAPSVVVNEGGTASNTGTYNDADTSQTVSITASVGTVTKTGTNSGTWSWSLATTDGPNQSQTVTITANDGNGGVTTTTFPLTVNNVAPNLAVNVGSTNTVYYVNWTSANPGAGTASGVINLPDGSTVNVTFQALNPNGSSSFFYGAQTNGGDNFWVPSAPYISTEVPNAPPDPDIIQLSGGNSTIYKVTLSQPIVDPIMAIVSLGSGGNTITYNFDSTFAIVSQGAGFWGGCATCLVKLPNNVLQGTEGHGTIKFLGTYSTFSWTVPSPEVWHGFTFAIRTTASLGNTNVNEGQTATNTGTWSDPGVNDNVALRASVGQVVKNAYGTWNWSFNTTDGPAQSQTVTITATDKDGASTIRSFPLVVNNVPPTANAGPDKTQFWGLPVAFTGAGADVSPVDVAAGLIATWVFGDGPGTASGFSVTHTYAAPGGYTATLTVKDKDGGAGSDTALATINKRGTTVAYTGATTSTFGFAATLSAKLTDVVDAGTALLGGRTITFTVNGTTITATTNASGVATATAPALLMPGTYPVAVGFASDSHYLASSAQGTLTVQNTVGGKVTAGTLRSANNGRGGFNVQADGAGVKGELQFQNDTVNFHAPTMTALGVSPDKKKAWFAGVGKDGTPFVAYVEDNGEPGRNDKYQIWIGGTSQNGDGSLTGGNVQIH